MSDLDPTGTPPLTYIGVMALSIFGGVVAIITMSSRNRRKCSFFRCVGRILTSAFTGLTVYYFGIGFRAEPNMLAGLIAVSGHLGVEALNAIEDRIRMRIGVAAEKSESDEQQ